MATVRLIGTDQGNRDPDGSLMMSRSEPSSWPVARCRGIRLVHRVRVGYSGFLRGLLLDFQGIIACPCGLLANIWLVLFHGVLGTRAKKGFRGVGK